MAMLRGIKKKVSTLWQKRKASRRTSTPPSSAETSSIESYPDDSAVSENPPLPPRPIPSVISTDEHEQRPPHQTPTSLPSTVSALSNYQHDRPIVQERANEQPSTPEQDPYATKYVPYTDVNPLKNNISAQTAGIYGRVNPDIMGGFGNDDSIWLVDDEKEEGPNQYQNVSQSRLESPAGSTSRLTFLGQRYERADHSSTHLQQASTAAAPAPSAEPAFRYQRPAFLGDDDDLTSGSLAGTEEAGKYRYVYHLLSVFAVAVIALKYAEAFHTHSLRICIA
ncbi:hypothetical protein NW768_003899 [Fusarium equiseti]|uniref:Uncharacterized protein n=1 Tax=Fusarium equiseti TaxID=61235 RepID=A0ABQ8RJ16_FUSEQ|nr:hypothetical protein NW768_003899 [Fusarium equiseti]